GSPIATVSRSRRASCASIKSPQYAASMSCAGRAYKPIAALDETRQRQMTDIAERIANFIEPFRVSPGADVGLARDFDPAFKAGIEKKKDGAELLDTGVELLSDHQGRLAAQDTHGLLVVLQALDGAGKDGAIRHVMKGVNPQGVRVESFKVPS